jgi:hypothetical protein
MLLAIVPLRQLTQGLTKKFQDSCEWDCTVPKHGRNSNCLAWTNRAAGMLPGKKRV